MRLAIIHPFLFRFARGIERYVWDLSTALARKGVTVDLLTWNDPADIKISHPANGVRVHAMPYVRYFTSRVAVPFYMWHLLATHYDWVIIHFAGYGEAEALTLTQRLRPLRYAIVFHYPVGLVPHRYREFERFDLARRAARLIAVSRFVAEGVERTFGQPCVVIHHGVDAERFRPNAEARRRVRSALGIPPEAPVLITSAALEERKGVQWVVRALPQILESYPDLFYLVLGDGPYRADLEGLIVHLGLNGRVLLLGTKADVAPYLAAADVGIILARGEASSLAGLEYMATALPVVAAKRRPFDELMRPEWAVLVDEEDTVQVAAVLKGLLADPQRRQQMGRAGREWVLSHHRWEHVAERYLNLLGQL